MDAAESKEAPDLAEKGDDVADLKALSQNEGHEELSEPNEEAPPGLGAPAWGQSSLAAKDLEKNRQKQVGEDEMLQPLDLGNRRFKDGSNRRWTGDLPRYEHDLYEKDAKRSFDDNEFGFGFSDLGRSKLGMVHYGEELVDHSSGFNMDKFDLETPYFNDGGLSNPEPAFKRDVLNFPAETPEFYNSKVAQMQLPPNRPHTLSVLPPMDELNAHHEQKPHGSASPPPSLNTHSFSSQHLFEDPRKSSDDREADLLAERLRLLQLKKQQQGEGVPPTNPPTGGADMQQQQFEYDPWENAYLNNYVANLSTYSGNNNSMNVQQNQSLAAAVLSKRIRNNNNFSAAPTGTLTKSNSLTGPVGGNLFVFNFPRHFTDQDLCREFTPFGRVLSATVFIDKATGRSKCFGFVSYDNVESARQAIATLNGCQMGGKVIKVQLKRESQGGMGMGGNPMGMNVNVQPPMRSMPPHQPHPQDQFNNGYYRQPPQQQYGEYAAPNGYQFNGGQDGFYPNELQY